MEEGVSATAKARGRRIMLYSLAFGIGLSVLVFGFFMLFPRAGNSQSLIGIQYGEPNGKPMIVAAYVETSYNESNSTDLEGYELRAGE